MTGRRDSRRRRRSDRRDEIALAALLVVTVVTDALPAWIRFGHWQKVLGLLAPRERPSALPKRPSEAVSESEGQQPVVGREPGIRCLVVAGSLDMGGVESVVSTLALGLPRRGIDVEVVTTCPGRAAETLTRSGVRVTSCPAGGLRALVDARKPDVVQLHRPSPELVATLVGSEVPVVPVFHAMESYLDRRAWALLAELTRPGDPCIAVSEGVRGFFRSRLGGADIQVVVNGVSQVVTGRAPSRVDARQMLGDTIGVELTEEDLLVVGLQRFSDQKNAPGLVDAFVLAADREPRLRLVLAGSPDNWLEFRKAEAIGRLSRHSSRIHLLDDSDAETILAAGDVYALDSFAEGGPLSAVEAVVGGLPVVLSDVGFSAELVASPQVVGVVVPRANDDYTQRSMAAQRRRRHQSNREAYAAALLSVLTSGGRGRSELPARFTLDAMLDGHASVLLRARARRR